MLIQLQSQQSFYSTSDRITPTPFLPGEKARVNKEKIGYKPMSPHEQHFSNWDEHQLDHVSRNTSIFNLLPSELAPSMAGEQRMIPNSKNQTFLTDSGNTHYTTVPQDNHPPASLALPQSLTTKTGTVSRPPTHLVEDCHVIGHSVGLCFSST